VKRISECRRCHAEMIWCRTGRGKKMPVDAEPTSDGVFVLEHGESSDPVVRRLSNDAAATYTGEKFTSHFATCPNADDFRNKGDRDA